jgi:hypothetical protein
MALKHHSGSNYKPKKKDVRELVARVTTIGMLLKHLNVELDKFTDEDLQTACHITRVSPEFISKMANACTELSDLLQNGGSFSGTEMTLATHLDRLSTALSVEYDSKFIGVEK